MVNGRARPLGAALLLPGVNALAGVVYRWVARNRHRFPGGTDAAAAPEAAPEPSAEQIQASTAALITLLVGSLWVLGIVARPYTWWKILLVGGSVAFYVVLFSIPLAQEKFFLDISDPETVGIGFAFGALAIVMVEVFRRVAPSLFRAVAHRRA